MKTDLQIQRDVLDELKWDPYLRDSEIAVTVKDGVVTLSGQVNTYAKKLSAEKGAKNVAGVKAVAQDIQIKVSLSSGKTDAEIAAAILGALKWHSAVQEEKIKITVEDGFVTMEGEVEWEYQRNSAQKAIENIDGVRYVANFIVVEPKLTVGDIKEKINSAFQRSATIDASKIRVDLMDNKVILRGKVRSFAEEDDAKAAAWAAPGVSSVESKLEIEIPEFALAD